MNSTIKIMKSINRKFIFSLLLLCLSLPLFAENKGLTHKVMDNGLEVFLLENKNTPLVTIELAFRAGSS
ncbi:MAG: hypothetical protein K5839_08510, partial [Treponemataceae bacterium]|nr:hypothetical protein [Treponemataceae bacterium]